MHERETHRKNVFTVRVRTKDFINENENGKLGVSCCYSQLQ